MTMRIYTYESHYLSGKPFVAVAVELPAGAPASRIEEAFEPDRVPDVEDRPPSEVLPLLEERLNRAWIDTARAEKSAVYAWCKQHMARLDVFWAEAQRDCIQKTMDRLKKQADGLRDQFLEIEQCTACHEFGPDAGMPTTEAEWAQESKYHAADCEWLAKARTQN